MPLRGGSMVGKPIKPTGFAPTKSGSMIHIHLKHTEFALCKSHIMVDLQQGFLSDRVPNMICNRCVEYLIKENGYETNEGC